MTPALADLHLHLYGCIRPADYLRHLAGRDEVDWEWYLASMEAAYGYRPGLSELLDRCAAGDVDAASEFEALFVFGDADAGNFGRFQAKFNLLSAGSAIMGLILGEPAARGALELELRFFLDAIRADQIRHGIGYAEQRILVGNLIKADDARAFIELVLGSYASGAGDLIQRLALSLPRSDPWPSWEVATELTLGPHGHAFTGVDFCFVEEGHPPKEKAEFFAAVHDFNERHPERALAILYHVGESFTDKSLESAVRWVQEAAELGVHRLGHAIALGVDPAVYAEHERTETVAERRDQIEYDLAHAPGLARHRVAVDPRALHAERERLAALDALDLVTHRYDATGLDEIRRRQDYAMERVAASGAVVEVCPTSNRRIGGITDPAHHPVLRFLERGVPVVVASDDPGIFGTTLSEEIDWVVRTAGLDEDGRRSLIDAAWRSRSEVLSGRERA